MNSVTSNAVFKASSPNYTNKQLIFDGLTHEIFNFTVPDNGIIIASGWGTGQPNSYILFTIGNITMQSEGYADEAIFLSLPVRKGDIVSINIFLASYNRGCYFVPYN
jgi:hypothetical protein